MDRVVSLAIRAIAASRRAEVRGIATFAGKRSIGLSAFSAQSGLMPCLVARHCGVRRAKGPLDLLLIRLTPGPSHAPGCPVRCAPVEPERSASLRRICAPTPPDRWQ